MAANVKKVKAEIEKAIKTQEEKRDGQQIVSFNADWDSVKWELTSFKVDTIDPSKSDPSAVMTTEWNNCVTLAQEEVWKDSTETDDTFTYSFQEGLELGAEVEVGEDLLVEEAKVKFSAKLSLSATQTKSVTNKRTREVDIKINVPACSQTSAQVLLYVGEFHTPLHVAVKATGPFRYDYKNSSGAEVASQGLTIEKVLAGLDMENRFEAAGSLGGSVGIKTEITTNDKKADCPPDSECTQKKIHPGKSSVVSGGVVSS